MLTKIINSHFTGKKVLIAPLDWGLGHTTRCIPIIRALRSLELQVLLAGNEEQEKLLISEFPDMTVLPLKGYQINYSRKFTALKLLSQVPKIISAIKRERAWLTEIVKTHNIDTVISDNRFGLHHPDLHSIFITHQLQIKSPFGGRGENRLQKWNYNFINRFNECWVPDFEGNKNLAGELSHPLKLPKIPTKYIGPLSRFETSNFEQPQTSNFAQHPADKPQTTSNLAQHPVDKLQTSNFKPQTTSNLKHQTSNHLLVILSGPEPQRSILENKLIEQLATYDGTAVVLRGLPGEAKLMPSTNQLHFYNHLPATLIRDEIEKASIVIARSGYSTVMDMITMGKKTILIPTPGQSEQEYLAKHLQSNKIAFCVKQNEFNLVKAMREAGEFDYRILEV